MFEFIQRFFGKPTSSATAKERLRLVLLSDHLSLAPDVVDALKHDLIEVISRYVDVDASNCDVTFEQREKQVAMLANIPILGHARAPQTARPAAAVPAASAGSGAGAGACAVARLRRSRRVARRAAGRRDAGVHEPDDCRAAGGGKKPTRRRRRKALSTNTAPQAT